MYTTPMTLLPQRNRTTRHFYASLALIASLGASFSSTVFAQKMYRCVDDKGVTHFGETMPAACAKKPVTELNKSGRSVRELDAPLTPQQQKEREEQAAKQKEIDKKITDQRLKDDALLLSFGAEREFDALRTRDLAQIDQRQKALERRSADIAKRVATLDRELEFYKDGKSKNAKGTEIPAELAASYDRVKADQRALQAEALRIEKERAATAVRYSADKQRWKRLKEGMAPGTILDAEGNVLHAPPARKAPRSEAGK